MKLRLKKLKQKLEKTPIKNPLAILGAIATSLSFFFPWWQIYLPNEDGGIYAYPYTVKVEAVLPELTIQSTTIRLIAFTSVLLIAIIITLYGAIKKGYKAKILLGVAGLLEIGIGYIFRKRIYERTVEASEHGVGMFRAPFELPASGETVVHGAKIIASFEMGLFLTFVGGIITLVSILLHDRLIN
ncbi:hypothetical protein C9439_00435 [archaeon SCG-AAA382B04]|nr:hypothetical protein C9439_00435 [archaeon SCG-AAA382B04]